MDSRFENCNELHIGNTPRSIMTKGTSTRRKNRLPGSLYGNFDPGNNDKLMISYRREPSHDYGMYGACGVLFEGEIHFFGGYTREVDLTRQHFVIEIERSGQLVKMTKKEDLEIGFRRHSCSSFEITSDNFPWFQTNVILCFDLYRQKSCYSFDGKLTFLAFSNYEHSQQGLSKYKENILTVGHWNNQKTEILKMGANKIFSWSVAEPDFKFNPSYWIRGHSFVTVESSYLNEECVLLIGGHDGFSNRMKTVFKFNGTWFPFGQLNKPRHNHNSIYWNEAVYVIGGDDYNDDTTKIEIWNIKNSSEQFKTKENWPELYNWFYPHLFIVPDSFFPDH